MFLQELNEFDIMDFGEKLNAYCVPEFNKDRTKVKIELHFEDMNTWSLQTAKESIVSGKGNGHSVDISHSN